MYAVPYGMPEGEQGNGVGAQGPGSPSIMGQMSTQLQNLALGPGPVCHRGGSSFVQGRVFLRENMCDA
jgi:hypothetical protein